MFRLNYKNSRTVSLISTLTDSFTNPLGMEASEDDSFFNSPP